METGIPSLRQVQDTHPAELAVVLSTLSVDAVFGLPADAVEAVVVATQKVASWAHAVQAMAVDRFAELATDQMEVHTAGVRAPGGSGAVPIPEPDAVAASSLAPLLNIAPRTMRTRLNRARLLMELPRTLGMALAGDLEPWRVDGVVVAAREVAPDRLAEFEARLHHTDVSRLPKPRLVDRARRAAAKADPDGTSRAHRLAPLRRGLRIAPSEMPGLMRWTADLPDDTSRALLGAVDALAQEYLTADRCTGARRTVEAARVDALTDLAMANATVETLVELVVPAATAPTPSLVSRRDRLSVIRDHLGPAGRPEGDTTSHLIEVDPVLVDLVAGNHTRATLAAGQLERGHGLRLGEHLETAGNPFLTTDRAAPPSRGPADAARDGGGTVWFVDGIVEAPGATALLPEHVVAILGDPTTRLRTSTADPGQADGPPARRRTYRPHRALVVRVRARDGHCRFPGCSVPARRCHLDHLVPFPLGDTAEGNLHCLCPTHHAFKHHAGWTVEMADDGSCTWTAPTGRTHTTTPASARETAA